MSGRDEENSDEYDEEEFDDDFVEEELESESTSESEEELEYKELEVPQTKDRALLEKTLEEHESQAQVASGYTSDDRGKSSKPDHLQRALETLQSPSNSGSGQEPEDEAQKSLLANQETSADFIALDRLVDRSDGNDRDDTENHGGRDDFKAAPTSRSASEHGNSLPQSCRSSRSRSPSRSASSRSRSPSRSASRSASRSRSHSGSYTDEDLAVQAVISESLPENAEDVRADLKEKTQDALLSVVGEDELGEDELKEQAQSERADLKEKAQDALLSALGEDELGEDELKEQAQDERADLKEKAQDALLSALGEDELGEDELKEQAQDERADLKEKAQDALLSALGEDELGEDELKEKAKAKARHAIEVALLGTGLSEEESKAKARDAIEVALFVSDLSGEEIKSKACEALEAALLGSDLSEAECKAKARDAIEAAFLGSDLTEEESKAISRDAIEAAEDDIVTDIGDAGDALLCSKFAPPDKASPSWKRGQGPAAQAFSSFQMRNRGSPKYGLESENASRKGREGSRSSDLFSVFRTGDKAKFASKRASRAVQNEIEHDWDDFNTSLLHMSQMCPYDPTKFARQLVWEGSEGQIETEEVQAGSDNIIPNVVVTPASDAKLDLATENGVNALQEPSEALLRSIEEEKAEAKLATAEHDAGDKEADFSTGTSQTLSKLEDFIATRNSSKQSAVERNSSKQSAADSKESGYDEKQNAVQSPAVSSSAKRKISIFERMALQVEMDSSLPPPGHWRVAAIKADEKDMDGEPPKQAKAVELEDYPLWTWDHVSDYCKERAWDWRRDIYEGGQEVPRDKLLELIGGRRSLTEQEKFLNLLKEKGDGSVGIAWRRYFDTDGDGALSFIEFCDALTAVNYKGDALELWRDFAGDVTEGGECCNELGLEVLDAESAHILDFFTKWCVEKFGGPMEMFQILDDDGSDCLDKDEFAEGIRGQSFFNCPDLPAVLDSEEKVLNKLYPLLDSHCTGVIQPDQLLFLEKDDKKKQRWIKLLQQKRDGHVQTDIIEEPNRADSLLKEVAWDTTRCGKSHWGMLGPNAFLDPPPSDREPRKSSSLPQLTSQSYPTRGRKPVPRFLREFREAKRKEKVLGGGQLDRVGTADRVSTAASTSDLRSLQVGGLGINPVVVGSASFGKIPQPQNLCESEAPWLGELGYSSPPGSKPSPAKGRTRKKLAVAWASSPGDASQIISRRKAYGGSFVNKLPKANLQRCAPGLAPNTGNESAMEIDAVPRAESIWSHGEDRHCFRPHRTFDFFAASKALSLFNHYGIGHL